MVKPAEARNVKRKNDSSIEKYPWKNIMSP
jgi:hypothetical protein